MRSVRAYFAPRLAAPKFPGDAGLEKYLAFYLANALFFCMNAVMFAPEPVADLIRQIKISTSEVTMKYANSKIAAICAVAVFAGLAGIQALNAQQAPQVKRTLLLKQDMVIQGREAVMALVELPPGSAEGRHTHPAELYVFVQEGTILLENEGKLAVTHKAGDVFFIAPENIHQAINNGSVTAKLAAVFVAEKGKPLTMSAE